MKIITRNTEFEFTFYSVFVRVGRYSMFADRLSSLDYGAFDAWSEDYGDGAKEWNVRWGRFELVADRGLARDPAFDPE
ncbi:MAG: hypothetical protein AB7O65_10180 [Candidatus Korobacteraceae bacterium]